jgi:hypothetical protein
MMVRRYTPKNDMAFVIGCVAMSLLIYVCVIILPRVPYRHVEHDLRRNYIEEAKERKEREENE